jgi:tetratricopeptide (TPR) repeat protein
MALLLICTGAAMLLAHHYHVGFAALAIGVVVGLPSLFVGVRAIPADASLPGLRPVVDELSAAITAPGAARTAPAVSLPPRPPVLAGRDSLLADLHSRLAGGDWGWPRVIVLTGLAGVGKTSIATEYAHRNRPAGVAWQFHAENPIALADEFAELSRRLSSLGQAADAEDRVSLVHEALASSDEPWLLIFDNAPDADSLQTFLPATGRGVVLITSQSALWGQAETIEVPGLADESAISFLLERTRQTDRLAAAELAHEATGLPLALEQMGGYISATGVSLDRYLDMYQGARPKMLARGKPVGYPKTVVTAFSLAFAHIEREAPRAAGLMRLLACLAPDPVPIELLLRPLEGSRFSTRWIKFLRLLPTDPVSIPDAVAELRKFSLVRPAGSDAVVAHRLVIAVALGQLGILRSAYMRLARRLVAAAVPADVGLPRNWPTLGVLLPHAQLVLRDDAAQLRRLAAYLAASGSYRASRDLLEKAAMGPVRRGRAGSADMLVARLGLATQIGHAGNAAQARDMLTELLPACERILGSEHPETLACRSNLAAFTGQAGKPVQARDLYSELVQVYQRVLGPDDPRTVQTRGQLAVYVGEAGDPARARDMFAELHQEQERTLGPEHPTTMKTLGHLAFWTGHAGDRERARDLFAELRQMQERVLGPEHPSTLATLSNLALLTGQAGSPARARDLYLELLPIRERVLGREHPETLMARNDLAAFTDEAGDHVRARDLYVELQPVQERVLGPEHPETLKTRGNIASLTGRAGNAARARDLFAQLLHAQQSVLGRDHPDTLNTLNHVAYWTAAAGNPALARDLLAELLPIRERVLGPEHPDTQRTRDMFHRLRRQGPSPPERQGPSPRKRQGPSPRERQGPSPRRRRRG